VFTAQYVLHSTFCSHSVFMCFVWIWEQTAIISLYSIDWLVFITETECVYWAVRSTFYVLPTQCIYVFCVDVRTNSDYFTVLHWLVGFYNWDGVCLLRGTSCILRSAHTVYLCVLCGSQNKQRLFHCTALTDWLVFITETECVYFAVRSTFCPHRVFVFCVDLRTNSDYFTVQHWLNGFYNWDGVCLLRGTFYILRSAHTVYLCVLCGSENKQRLFHFTALTDWLVFITETECVYCAVRSTFYVLPTQCIYVFCVDLRTNSDYFTLQHW